MMSTYFYLLIKIILIIFLFNSYFCDKNLKSIILKNFSIFFCDFSKKNHKTYIAFNVSQIKGDNIKSVKAIKKDSVFSKIF